MDDTIWDHPFETVVLFVLGVLLSGSILSCVREHRLEATIDKLVQQRCDCQQHNGPNPLRPLSFGRRVERHVIADNH
ncbi:MAG: hypothetical protein L0Z50_38570 [Verrucomicrobiales bacterium]|nr:hypothetical protein [Verrucomicrobiales bacterium]